MIDFCIADFRTPELAADCRRSIMQFCDVPHNVWTWMADKSGHSYAESINLMAKLGKGDIICALNADTLMLESPNPILNLFDSDPSVAVVGPRQIDERGRITHAGIFGTNKDPEQRLFHESYDTHKSDTGGTRDAISVAGSVYFVRRSIFEELGGFMNTPGAPMFYEETFFSYLARHRGYRVLYTGASTWMHLFDSSLPSEGVNERTRIGNDNQKRQWFEQARRHFQVSCAREGIEC